MSSKLALHLQAHPGWSNRSAALWIKIMDPPGENRWPGKKIIGRVYMPDSDSNALVARGAAGADDWFRFCQPTFARAPYIRIWEGPNEPQPVADIAFCHKLADFTLRLADLMHQAGLRLVGGNLSEGNPGGDDTERRARFVAIARGLAACDYWSQHAYWVLDWPHPEAGMNEWHAFRYRMNMRYAQDAGIVLPPLLITECGVDGGVVGLPKRGWMTFCHDRADYLRQLAIFDAELAQDPEVLAATIFTAGPMGWSDFEIDEELNDMINAHIAQSGGSYTPPETSLGALLALEFGDQYEDLTATLPVHASLRYQKRPLTDITQIVLHHTEVDRLVSWRTVAQYHVNQHGWPGIAYHVGIRQYGDSLKVSLLNDPSVRSFHAGSVGNSTGIAVCMAGRFDAGAPTDAEVSALHRVVAMLRRWATWSGLPVTAHGDVPGNQTACPGQHLRAVIPALNGGFATELRAAAAAAQVIQFNPDAALQKRIFADGFVPNSPEFSFAHGAVQYVAQRAEHLATGAVRVYYAQYGLWDDVRFV